MFTYLRESLEYVDRYSKSLLISFMFQVTVYLSAYFAFTQFFSSTLLHSNVLLFMGLASLLLSIRFNLVYLREMVSLDFFTISIISSFITKRFTPGGRTTMIRFFTMILLGISMLVASLFFDLELSAVGFFTIEHPSEGVYRWIAFMLMANAMITFAGKLISIREHLKANPIFSHIMFVIAFVSLAAIFQLESDLIRVMISILVSMILMVGIRMIRLFARAMRIGSYNLHA